MPWEERFDELEAYHAEHGHIRVSDLKLAKWVREQREQHRLGKLRPERREKLESLGFDFSPQYVEWEERFGELEAYHAEHGHTRVSELEDLKLAMGVQPAKRAPAASYAPSAARSSSLSGSTFLLSREGGVDTR